MTVVLALMACEGVAVVADGQATAGNGLMLTRTPVEKLGDLHGRIAYGCAGSAGLRQRVVANLNGKISPEHCGQDLHLLRPKLRGAVNEIQKEAESEFVRKSLLAEAEGIQVLFAGVSDAGKPWILEISETGVDEEHLKAEAIGVGRPYARYAMVSAEHHGLRDRGLAQVATLAYRAINDAIRTAATDLGLPISMYQVTRDGARPVTGDELKAVENAVVIWQGSEREIFHSLRDDDAEPPPVSESRGIDAPPPEPDDANDETDRAA